MHLFYLLQKQSFQTLSAAPTPIPRGVAPTSATYNTMSTSSEDYRTTAPAINLAKFACTEKVSYLGEFDLSDDSSESESDADSDFGQDLYLGKFGVWLGSINNRFYCIILITKY